MRGCVWYVVGALVAAGCIVLMSVVGRDRLFSVAGLDLPQYLFDLINSLK